MNQRGSGRSARPSPAPDVIDQRISSWLTASEDARARPVLDLAFADLAHVRQERRWPWTAFTDPLAGAVSIQLPRLVWIVLVLLLVLALTVVGFVGAERLGPLLDQLSALPTRAAVLSSAACSPDLASSTSVACFVAAVPRRHERPGDGSINLSVIEFRPRSAESEAVAASTPILVLDVVDPSGERTRLDFDARGRGAINPIIAVEPRGTGAGASSLACPEVDAESAASPTGWLSDPVFRGSLEHAIRGCRDRLIASGVDVSAYDLPQVAADLESIRAGLGIERWIVRARGPEVRVALELVRRYPASVAGVVLVDPALSADGEAQAASLDVAVRELTQMCAADDFCATQYRRPSDAFASILARLATGPAVVVVDGPARASVTVQVDQALVRAAVAEAISGTSTVGTLPSRLDRMASGDLAWPAERLVSRGWCLGSGLVCSPAIDASDGADFAFSCGGGIAGTPWDVICPAWLGDDRPSPAGSPSNRDIPTVALVGRTSPWAKPDEVEAALSGLARHTILATPWVPESFEFRCLGPTGSNWYAAPGQVAVSSCTEIALPVFVDAP
jgi:pimeloyl-ACP methyl ester carboxylesterase